MIYSPVFTGLPDLMKQRIYRRLGDALRDDSDEPAGRHLPKAERQVVRRILRGTLADLPPDW